MSRHQRVPAEAIETIVIRSPAQHRAILAELDAVAPDPERPPLPAGHPTSWGAINAGTVLEGSRYA